ncbi:polysaccharide deacetylase family protein [uncultured Desulfosarcina sp.]|uniref:polysaccharide deacetylase family protein n=1 Tax=uncultured Desulfosarcina sp. TaxID=218289 RepID=UPI0029C70364|nr:polysaccharide deacetylase family protein [uncultured Desulfosarcina sp.]
MISRVITHVQTRAPVAALTFDDGPHPDSTPRVLDVLGKFGVRATFFMIGQKARQYPQIVRMVAEAGHAIGNHAWQHTNLTKIRSRLRRLKQLLACARATAPYHQRIFRPPYGAHDRSILLDAMLLRYKVILWNASAQDWTFQGPEDIAQKMISRITPGSIFLLHDAISAEKKEGIERDRQTMLSGLERALSAMASKMQFVTVPELLRYGPPGSKWPLQ